MSLLALNEVSVDFGGLAVLRGLSLSVESGERHGLVGLNGSGKSTALAVAGGQILQRSAAVHLSGQPVGAIPPWERAQLGLARLFQESRLWPTLSAREHLDVVVRARSAVRARVAELLELTGFDPARLDALPAQLGLLERRRLELALALTGARVLASDEIAAGLAAPEAATLYVTIDRAIAAGLLEGALLVEHRLDVLLDHADSISVLEDGQIVRTARGSASDLADAILPHLSQRAAATRVSDPTPRGL